MKKYIFITIICCLATFFCISPVKHVNRPSNYLYYQSNIIDFSEIQCLADNIYFEARSEPDLGKYAVAKVTINRVNDPYFPESICDVVQQERRGICQFSWWCDPDLRDKAQKKLIDGKAYQQIKLIALETYLLHDEIDVGLEGATFYHASYINKKKIGVAKLEKTAKIGKHIFYVYRGDS